MKDRLQAFLLSALVLVLFALVSTPATAVIAACGNVSTSDVLTGDIAGAGTCLTVTADNVEINCQGNTISYDTGGGGDDTGIDIDGRDNVTIRNCIIEDTSAGGTAVSAINASSSSNLTIFNNTLTAFGTNSARAVELRRVNTATITRNSFLGNGSGPSHMGINFVWTEFATVRDNTMRANGTSGAFGLFFSFTNFTTIANNNVTVTGDSNTIVGVRFSGLSTNDIFENNTFTIVSKANGNTGLDINGTTHRNMRIHNNTIDVRGAGVGGNRGIEVRAINSNITSNTIRTNSTSGNANEGIFLEVAANSRIIGNTIRTDGAGNDNIGIDATFGGDNNNLIQNNDIITNGTDENYGIFLQNNDANNTIQGNTIYARGSGQRNRGIILSGSVINTSIRNNTIRTNGTLSNTGLRIESNANQTTINQNTIVADGSSTSNFGVYILSSDNTVNQNTIATYASLSHGIRIDSATDHTFDRNNITTNTSDSSAIAFGANTGGTLTNNLLNNPGQWIDALNIGVEANFTNTTFNQPNGSIRIPDQFTFNTTDVLKEDLNITFNRAFLNSTQLPFLNQTGVITLNGITLADPSPFVDFDDDGTFEPCPANICTELSFIGNVFVFNTSQFSAFKAAVAPIEVNTCGNINRSTILNESINVNIAPGDACFNFTVDNVFLDCEGNQLIGNGSGIGVKAGNVTNITIENCEISNFTRNIDIIDTNFSTIRNVTARNATSDSIRLLDTLNSTITNSIIRSTTDNALQLRFADFSTITNSIITSTSGRALFVSTGSGFNTFQHLQINSTLGRPLFYLFSENNTVINTTAISDAGSATVHLDHGENNAFIDSTFIANSAIAGVLNWALSSVDNVIRNSTLETPGTWIGAIATNSVENITFQNDNGSINILPLVNFTTFINVDNDNLNISFNNAFLNSTNLTELNTSGIITLNNITFANPAPFVDFDDDGTFEPCPANICTELSFNGNVFVFNTSQFSAFKAGQNLISACGNVSGTSVLNQTLVSNDTCLNIIADDITLDCDGNAILYNRNGGSSENGIRAENRTNITVQNCFIRDINSSSEKGWGINLTRVNSSSFINNTIRTNGTEEGIGVGTTGHSHNNIYRGNNIFARGTLGNNQGFSIQTLGAEQANNNLISNNTIRTTGGDQANFGLNLRFRGTNNMIHDNTIRSNGTRNSPSIILQGNGVGTTAHNNTQVINNSLTATTVTDLARGIVLFAGTFNFTIQNNTLSTSGTTNNDGIALVLSNSNHLIKGNTITVNGSTDNNDGIASLSADNANNRIISNNIFASGSATSHGIHLLLAGPGYTITGNTIHAAGTNSYGFFAPGANTSQLFNTTFNDTVQWVFNGENVSTNLTNTTFNQPNGSITINGLAEFTNTTNVSKNELRITFKEAFLNSTNLTPFNQSGIIVLRNITDANPVPTVDFDDDGTFEVCFACNIISFIGNVFTYTVPQFTTYSLESGNISLTLSKSDNPDLVNNGSQLTYQITLTVNNGSIFNATITETYPANTTFNSSTPAPDAGDNVFNIGNLTGGDQFNITIVVNVSAAINASTNITNTINLTFVNGTGGTQTATVNETTNVTILGPAPPAPARQAAGGGGGGGSGITAPVCPEVCDNPRYQHVEICRTCVDIQQPACTEQWSCSFWTPCENGKQYRTCNDLAACGTTIQQPATERSCNSIVKDVQQTQATPEHHERPSTPRPAKQAPTQELTHDIPAKPEHFGKELAHTLSTAASNMLARMRSATTTAGTFIADTFSGDWKQYTIPALIILNLILFGVLLRPRQPSQKPPKRKKHWTLRTRERKK